MRLRFHNDNELTWVGKVYRAEQFNFDNMAFGFTINGMNGG